MALGDDIGKIAVTTVDALTPRGVRLIVVFLAAANAYGWWLHQDRLASQERAIVEFKAETAKLNVQLQLMVKSADEGNAELRGIRQWLMNAPRR